MKVFLSHNLDSRCGIHAFAAGKHGFGLENFLAELNAAEVDAAAPAPSS